MLSDLATGLLGVTVAIVVPLGVASLALEGWYRWRGRHD